MCINQLCFNRIPQQRADPSGISCVSMKSDRSKGRPFDFKHGQKSDDQKWELCILARIFFKICICQHVVSSRIISKYLNLTYIQGNMYASRKNLLTCVLISYVLTGSLSRDQIPLESPVCPWRVIGLRVDLLTSDMDRHLLIQSKNWKLEKSISLTKKIASKYQIIENIWTSWRNFLDLCNN